MNSFRSVLPFFSRPSVASVTFSLAFLGVLPLYGMGMLYSDEVSTFREVGYGHEVGDSVYFLINYGLYRRPKGIARFPDGGISRYITRTVYLCRADRADGSVHNVIPVMPGDDPGLDVKSSYYEFHEEILLVMFRTGYGAQEDPGQWHALRWNTRTESSVVLTDAEKETLLRRLTVNHERRIGINETTELLEQATLRDLDLPSPLDYMRWSDRRHRNALVELRVDTHYRRAVVEGIADGSIRGNPERILRRIEKRLRSLDEPVRTLYEMRVGDVIETLEALNE
ncbi:MAG: hypothetical protein ACLFSV_11585 [Alkalispirochaeta sp.]